MLVTPHAQKLFFLGVACDDQVIQVKHDYQKNSFVMPIVNIKICSTFYHGQISEKLLIFYCQAFWSPYNTLLRLQTKCSFPYYMNPSQCFIYTSSWKSPFKNVVLPSICEIFQPRSITRIITYLIMFHLILVHGFVDRPNLFSTQTL